MSQGSKTFLCQSTYLARYLRKCLQNPPSTASQVELYTVRLDEKDVFTVDGQLPGVETEVSLSQSHFLSKGRPIEAKLTSNQLSWLVRILSIIPEQPIALEIMDEGYSITIREMLI